MTLTLPGDKKSFTTLDGKKFPLNSSISIYKKKSLSEVHQLLYHVMNVSYILTGRYKQTIEYYLLLESYFSIA